MSHVLFPSLSSISSMLLPNFDPWLFSSVVHYSVFSFAFSLRSLILKSSFLAQSQNVKKKKKRLLFEIGSVNIIKLPLIFSASQDLFPTAFQHFVILKMDNYHFQFCRFLETLIVSFTGLESSHEHFSHVRWPKAVFKCDLVFTEIH